MKQILTKRGEIKALMELFGCAKNTVIGALRFQYNTELSIKIRNAAIKRGGVEVN